MPCRIGAGEFDKPWPQTLHLANYPGLSALADEVIE